MTPRWSSQSPDEKRQRERAHVAGILRAYLGSGCAEITLRRATVAAIYRHLVHDLPAELR